MVEHSEMRILSETINAAEKLDPESRYETLHPTALQEWMP